MWKKQSQVNHRKDSDRRGVQASHQVGPWHAVSVTTGQFCCEAARGLIGRRFLAAQAPRLPLTACTGTDESFTGAVRHAVRRINRGCRVEIPTEPNGECCSPAAKKTKRLSSSSWASSWTSAQVFRPLSEFPARGRQVGQSVCQGCCGGDREPRVIVYVVK